MIYFMQATDGRIKIGTTDMVVLRQKQLEKATGGKLTLLATMDGSFPEESALHRRFASQRVKGTEFFHPCEELLSVVRSATPPRVEEPREVIEWISAAAAGRILGIDLRTFRKRSVRWDIRQQVLLGCNPRYCRADVERLARESVTAA